MNDSLPSFWCWFSKKTDADMAYFMKESPSTSSLSRENKSFAEQVVRARRIKVDDGPHDVYKRDKRGSVQMVDGETLLSAASKG